MPAPRNPRFASATRLGAPLLLLMLAGCAGETRPFHGSPSAESDAVPRSAAPDMSAHGMFFGGQIEVESLLNSAGFGARGGKAGAGEANGAPTSSDSGGGRRRGGFPGSAGAGGYSGGMGGGRRQRGGGGGGAEERSPDTDSPAPQIRASNAPPIRLHLRLTNHGTAPVEVEVVDFNSDLGNFVVQPPKLTLPPGGTVEAEPMISRLGVNAGEIPLTVNLRIAGHGEKQVLMLRVIPPPAGG